MIDSDAFRDVLVEKLRSSGLEVTHECYQNTFDRILACGNIQSQYVIQLVGEAAWEEVLARSYFADPGYVFKRIMGFGYCFTEYIIEDIGLNAKDRNEIQELGALSNFIVSIYDHFLDNNLITSELPLLQLIESIRKKETIGFRQTGIQFFGKLVQRYLERAYALSAHDSGNRAWRTLTKAIISMYQANKMLLQGSVVRQPYRVHLQKSALPIVVMGLPAWIATIDKSDAAYFRHLRWMYALGEFLAWIDDAADLDDDERTSQPNLVIDAMGTGGLCNHSFDMIAASIAEKGRSVDNAWKSRTGKKNHHDPGLLPVCVISWLGEYYLSNH
jgi:hypothetical protein